MKLSSPTSQNVDLILSRLRASMGIKTDAELAKRLQVTPQAISTWRKRGKVNLDEIFALCEGISLDYIMYGGDISPANHSVLGQGAIPLLDQRVAAGPLETYVDQSPDVEHIDLPDMPKGQGWLAVRAHGDSMEPTIIDGDILICRKVNPYEFENNRVYVVEIVGEGYHVKRVLRLTREARLLLKSDNRARPNTSYSNEQVGSIYEVKRRITYDLSGPEGVYERLSQHEVMLHELHESIQRLIANKQS